jgi:hypothetical protein
LPKGGLLFQKWFEQPGYIPESGIGWNIDKYFFRSELGIGRKNGVVHFIGKKSTRYQAQHDNGKQYFF